jgi:hypothetical protein
MATIVTIVKWVSLGAVILVASFAVGGVYHSVAVSNGNSAGDIYLFNRFTGAFYVCRNRTCQPGKLSP